MSYQPIGINQGDIIYFYDTSLGPVNSWDWFFPGGSATGATAWGPIIQYNSTNTNGWDVSLLVTDSVGATSFAIARSIIFVFPEDFSVSFGISPSSSLMDEAVTYLSSATAGSGLTGSGYSWIIPGLGSTAGISLSSVTYSIPEWFDLTGTYAGAPNSSFLSTASLSLTSVVGNSSSTSENITFYKLGPLEEVNYGLTGSYGISGPYYTPTVSTYKSSDLNLGGTNIVLEIDQNFPASAWDNLFFHSTDEAVYFFPNTTDYSANFSPIKFKFIWGGSNLSLAGVSVPSLDRFNIGNYIITGDVSNNFSDKFWLTDYTSGGGQLTANATFTGSLSRQWSNNYIESLMSNLYHLSNSSKFIENAGFNIPSYTPLANLSSVVGFSNLESGYNWNGGYTGSDKHGVCVPSSSGLNALYGVTNAVVDVDINLYDETNSLITTINSVLSAAGATGNTPDGYLVKAQTDGYGQGIVDKLNSDISSAGMSSYILAESASYFSSYEGGGGSPALYDANTFNGIQISVLQPEYSGNYINSIEIVWGMGYTGAVNSISGLSSNSILRYPFAGTSTNTSSYISWTGLNQKLTTNPNTNPYFRGWKLGGSL